MKMFLAILVSVFCLQAHAGARLSLQANQFDGKDGVYPIIGLSLDQRLIDRLFVTSWVGMGSRPVQDGESKDWGSGKLGLEYRFSFLHFGAGAFGNTGGGGEFEDLGLESGIYAKVSMRLW